MDGVTHILLIDDDAVDRAAVRRALARSSLAHELHEAIDGETGLSLAVGRAFDCVLLDYRLPDVDTFDLLPQLLGPEGGAQAVLMLTGEADPDIALRLMRAGALDYLAKAEVTPSGLERSIRHAKARREILGDLRTARLEAEGKSVALDQLNRQKSLLFSIIAHDLRNPFQALLNLSATLSRAVADKDHASVERRAAALHEAAEQAHALMQGLFSWASLQMDTIEVALDPVDVGDVAEEVAACASEAAAGKGLELRTDCDGCTVVAHRDMLAAVLRNLVSNAVKFSLAGGVVTIGARRDGDGIEVAVSDTGVGMSPEAKDDLFKPDRRSTTHGTAGERGSGLGLLLCRDLVERQGGELRVASAAGRGTTFSFRLRSCGA